MRELNEMELDAVCGGRNIQVIAFVRQSNKSVVVKSFGVYVSQSNNVQNNNDVEID
jgi:hypothetical protein